MLILILPSLTMQKTSSNGYGWLDPDWQGSALAWVSMELARLGIGVTGAAEQPHVRPWSTIMRVPTAAGPVWFKANGPSSLHEAVLVEALGRWVAPSVPVPLATDVDRGWMLLPDAGTSLDDVLARDGDLRHWERALVDYAELQRKLVARVPEMLSLGVPDCRPEVLPMHLEALLDNPAKVMVGAEGGLSEQEYRRLRVLRPRFGEWCARLAEIGIQPSIQHDDLHETNIFFSDAGHTFLDWADASVAHPFGSLIYPLRLASERFGLPIGGRELHWLRDAYLEPWTADYDHGALEEATLLAMHTATVGRALAWQRAVTGVERQALKLYYRTGIPRWLTDILRADVES
jgi:Phosphotransferase enzyme family